jgi:PAS domain S-box-containing protein
MSGSHFFDEKSLIGGGEMGKRIAAFDWSKHPLGPIEFWPQSLKIIVHTMLHSRYAMWLGWGPEFYFFCNDAYLPTLGIKENWALGASAQKVWAEIWPDIGPRAESVVRTGEATWDEALLLFLERSGYTEETYHTFSYSPIAGDSGAIGGMLCVVTEDTERVVQARRLDLLRKLGIDLSAINTEEELFSSLRKRLADYGKDLPFALVYTFSADGARAELACAHGAQFGEGVAPNWITTTSKKTLWPARQMYNGAAASLIQNLAGLNTAIPTGPWSAAPRQAVILPIAGQGQEKPAGFLVAGINPFRLFDDDYRGFIQLLAGQIGSAISSMRAYEEERRRAEALAQIDRAKTTFFSNVSHEFRTPLTLMLGPLEDSLVDFEQPLAPQQRDRLWVAHRNSLRLLKLVNSLLDFSRIEAGRIQAVYEPVDLAKFTAELASAFQPAIDKAGMKLIVDCPVLSQPVFVDRDMWEKIVLNLISNAFKYTFEGEITVKLRANRKAAILTVRDTGSGIAAEALPHLFERFYRVEGAYGRTYEGTGIGLALVQELVNLHNGKVSVESVVGTGSAFTVAIPLGKAHLPADRINASRTLPPSAIGAKPFVEEAQRWLPDNGDGNGHVSEDELEEITTALATALPPIPGDQAAAKLPRILLAEDNGDMRQYIRRLLSDRYEVEMVTDGAAALAAARAFPPDLILSDVMMPGLDGFELLRALRSEPTTQAVPVILLSARAGEESRVESLQAGADDYLIKPFSARELIARVDARLELARVRRESEERYRSLIQSLPAAVYTCDAAGRITLFNDAAVALWGREPELNKDEWCGSLKIYRPDGTPLPVDLCPMAVTLKEGRAVRGEEIVIERPDGTRRNVMPYPEPMRDASGAIAGAVNMLVDISDYKTAQQALRESEERFARFMRHLPGMAWIKDTGGRYIFASDAALKAFGTTQENLYGRTDRDIFPAETAAVFRENDRLALTSESGMQSLEELAHEDGTIHVSIVHKFPIPGPSDKPTLIGGIAIDITERKRAEDRLRKSEERLRMATQTGRVGVWDWDIQQNHISWTDSLFGIHGLKPGEFDGTIESFAALIHSDDREQVLAALQLALDGDTTYELEFRLVRPSGEIAWIFTNATVIRDNGVPVRMIGATVDISERKRVETALRDSEERVHQLLTLMPAAVYTCDHTGRITYFNRRAAELWGREPRLNESSEKFSGSYCLWRPDGSLLPRDQTPMAVALREGVSTRDTEVVIEQPDGARLVSSGNIEPLHDHLGRRIGAISVFDDISKRKLAEQELRRHTDHIQLLSETLAQLLRASEPESIIRNLFVKVAAHVGADSYFNFMLNENEDGLELHSYAGIPDDIAKSIAHLDFGQTICGTVALTHQPITANDIQNTDYDKAALVRKMGIQTYACNPLMVGDRLFGTLSFASHTRKSFGADELEFLRIISQYAAIAMDRLRTGRALGESEERLRRQAQELEQQLIATGRLVSLGEITASMAHEFNNPLGIILGFVEDLLLGTHPADPNYRPLQIVNDEAKRCQRIIQDLMDYTRPRAVALSSTSLNLIIAKTLGLVETRLYKQKINLETTVEPNLPNVYADYQQLEQVFVNLYLNAIDAMPAGGTMSVSAKVDRQNEDASVVVAVSDSGFGIEKELLGRIFQPFYTAKKTRGMGLGLPICERIVRNHGGYIEVDSAVGRGTTFKVYLPLIESEHAARLHSL